MNIKKIDKDKIAAWAVHGFTASGAVLGFLAIISILDNDLVGAFLWLGLALLIDGIDGTLARKIGVIDKKNRVLKPNLYTQFSPMEIPDINHKYVSLKYKNNTAFRYDASLPILDESWRKIETLDTVLLSVKKEEERIEKIKRFNKGSIDVFNDAQRKNTTDFASYISTKGFAVQQDARDPRSLRINNTKRTTWNLAPGGGGATSGGLGTTDHVGSTDRTPVIYLNDLRIIDIRILMDIDMSTMDYVIIDKQGLGEGSRGADGVIKIYTNYLLRTNEYNVSRDSGQEIKFPLTFSASKQFYTPIYSSLKNDFYQNYGVIDWFPNCKSNENSMIEIKVLDTKNKQIKLFIEGIANDGQYISEEKIITLN